MPASASLTAERASSKEAYNIPRAPFDGDRVPMLQMEASVKRQAWRLGTGGVSPLQALGPIRDQLTAAGYDVLLECASQSCGGFDFRFSIDVLPGPAMFINLRDFHFLSLVDGSPDAPDAVVTLLASAVQDVTYVQIVEVRNDTSFQEIANSAPNDPVEPDPVDTETQRPLVATGTPEDLLTTGVFVLDGVAFETGATSLAEGSDTVLQQLADFLLANPSLRVALVGHTDSVGSLSGNISISKRRAQAVRKRLIDNFAIPAAQLDAEGMGYLSPRASNLTESGRTLNRRVEAIVVSTE